MASKLLMNFLLMLSVHVLIIAADPRMKHLSERERVRYGTIPMAPKRTNRVQIQVFRGANNEEEHYAPWGFIIRQPAETNHYYRR